MTATGDARPQPGGGGAGEAAREREAEGAPPGRAAPSSAADGRRARLARALRDNLARRKGARLGAPEGESEDEGGGEG